MIHKKLIIFFFFWNSAIVWCFRLEFLNWTENRKLNEVNTQSFFSLLVSASPLLAATQLPPLWCIHISYNIIYGKRYLKEKALVSFLSFMLPLYLYNSAQRNRQADKQTIFVCFLWLILNFLFNVIFYLFVFYMLPILYLLNKNIAKIFS